MFKKDFPGLNAAEMLVKCLEAEGVTHVFGIPGAKIDPVFEALAEGGPEFVVCRHEQNAAFIAGGIGRLTGRPGVCLTTSGPGVSNLATGLITATTEGHPVLALSGSVSSVQENYQTHQALDNVGLMRPVTKHAVSVRSPSSVSSAVANAMRAATSPRAGAAFVSLPYDIMLQQASGDPITPSLHTVAGAADADGTREAAEILAKAKMPVLLIGRGVSVPRNTEALRTLLRSCPMPVVGTYEAAGAISHDLYHCFLGRVGLFANQPGDEMLSMADVIVTVGFDEVEYDPEVWNTSSKSAIIAIHDLPAELHEAYQPKIELIGDIAATLGALGEGLVLKNGILEKAEVSSVFERHRSFMNPVGEYNGTPVHPLRFIQELQGLVDDQTTVVCDVGSVYIWMARHFLSYEPNRLLFSNGQQTLGVALPWAIASTIARPGESVISMSGDGGFLFSAMELETAVRLGSNFVHIVWRDGTYDMVGIQQELKYGRSFGVQFGEPDIVQFAEAFGAAGMRITRPDDIAPVLREALQTPGPVLVDMPVDYSDNRELCETVHAGRQH